MVRRLQSFVRERGPEAAADFLGPFAKWGLILVDELLLHSDADVKRIVGYVFGVNTDAAAPASRKSPLEVVGAELRKLDLSAAPSPDKKAAMWNSAMLACRLMMMMLLTIGLGWVWAIAFYVGFYTFHLANIKELIADKDMLFFQAAHFSLFVCDTIAIPATIPCRLLVHFLGLVVVLWIRANMDDDKSRFGVAVAASMLVLLFYTPLWFGLCLSVAFAFCVAASDGKKESFPLALLFLGTISSLLSLLGYVSGRSFLGALVFPAVLFVFDLGQRLDGGQLLEMAAPLPFTCALLCCTYLPSPVAIGITTIVCSLALAYDNGKVIAWWVGSLVGLHFLRTILSGGFNVVFLGILGSYLSYGCCIL